MQKWVVNCEAWYWFKISLAMWGCKYASKLELPHAVWIKKIHPKLWPLDVTAALHNKPRVGEGLMVELPILRPTVLLHRDVSFCIL